LLSAIWVRDVAIILPRHLDWHRRQASSRIIQHVASRLNPAKVPDIEALPNVRCHFLSTKGGTKRMLVVNIPGFWRVRSCNVATLAAGLKTNRAFECGHRL
jgi:hypothetical protein